MTVPRAGRQILIHGMALVWVGLVWGLVVPHTPYPRLALDAHIQFEGNGVLFIVVAILLLRVSHRVGVVSAGIMLLAVWLTWIMMFSEVANSWWGTTQILPIAARHASAMGAAPRQELVVELAHICAVLALIIGWALLLIGFIRNNPPTSPD